MTAPRAVQPPVAITGVGVLTPLGDSPGAVFAALMEGRSAVGEGGAKLAEIRDFEATKYANIRGMRMYNRTTRLAICAAKLALSDAKIEAASLPGEDLGVLMASTYGNMDVLLEYDRSLVEKGVQRTNGALMPLAIPSAPGAMVALAFGARAFSMTLGGTGSSFLDAIALGARWITDGRARACVVVSASSPSPEIVLAASRAGILSATEAPRVFDRRASGTAFGEAGVAFVLELAESASSRGAEVRGHVRGYGAAFAPEPSRFGGALERAIRGALRDADMTPAEIALVSAGASGLPAFDRAEAMGIHAALGAGAGEAPRVPVTAMKGALGETLDAGPGLQSLVALGSLDERRAPRIVGLTDPDVEGLHYLTQEEVVAGDSALVTSVSWSGACSALILSGGAHGRA